jgi:hypothetical protein
VFPVFLRLGLTSFGGPVAHLGYFRHEFVEKRRWLDETAYADVVALCQFLPGPASSETGIALGLMRAGLPGAFAAWLGFTAPSAILMILAGYGVAGFRSVTGTALLHGLKIVAVAVVAQAVIAMARTLTARSLPCGAGGRGRGAGAVRADHARPDRRDLQSARSSAGFFLSGAARAGAEVSAGFDKRWSMTALIVFFALS